LILKLSLEKWNSPTVAWSGGTGVGTDVPAVTRADAPWEFSVTATPDVAASATTKPLSAIARLPMCLPPDRCHPGLVTAGPVTLRGPSAPTHREKYAGGYLFQYLSCRQTGAVECVAPATGAPNHARRDAAALPTGSGAGILPGSTVSRKRGLGVGIRGVLRS
jgi:hypothetical protein